MEKKIKKPIGRPPLLDSERKYKEAASVTKATKEKARKHFGTLGKAIEWAVLEYEKNNSKKS